MSKAEHRRIQLLTQPNLHLDSAHLLLTKKVPKLKNPIEISSYPNEPKRYQPDLQFSVFSFPTVVKISCELSQTESMGKKKKNIKLVGGGNSQHCPSTVFVAGLPYSLTNAQALFIPFNFLTVTMYCCNGLSGLYWLIIRILLYECYS